MMTHLTITLHDEDLAVMRLAMCTYHTNRKFGRLSILADEKDNDIILDHIVREKALSSNTSC